MTDTTALPSEDEPFNLETWPLEKDEPFGTDWGGDGSDLLRPVRAHVLAALQPAQGSYSAPLDVLPTLGATQKVDERRDELPITQEHIPDLVRMARDRALYTADSDMPAVWATQHALYALTKLDASAVVADLTPLLDLDDDWLPNLLGDLFAGIGAPAIPPLQAYLADRSRWAWGHAFACDMLNQIVEAHPDLREPVVAVLREVLEQAETYNEQSVTAAMSNLVELKAVDTLPLIRRAFEIGKIDVSVMGSWGMVLTELDIEPDPHDPLVAASQQEYEAYHDRFRMQLGDEPYAAAPAAQKRSPNKRKDEQARKAKQKRKAAAASRKANKKKKRK